jgi:hypothetical protein
MSNDIYVASRVKHAQMWLNLAAMGAPIISTWIYEAGDNDTDDFGELWSRILTEIEQSRALVFYGAAGDDPWKGAFVEVGAALAFGKPVFVVLDGIELNGRTLRPVGSWLAHPSVRRCANVRQALQQAAVA